MDANIKNILKSYFAGHGVASHQISSWNRFACHELNAIIRDEPNVAVQIDGKQYHVNFDEGWLSEPMVIESDRKVGRLTPMDCRHRDLSYEGVVYCNVTEIWKTSDGKVIDKKTHRRVKIAKLPVMLHSAKCNLSTMSRRELIASGECEKDRGGYFIVKGHERVLVSQMRAKHNQIYVLRGDNYYAEMRSMSENTGHSVLVQAIDNGDKGIYFNLPYLKKKIPAGVVFKALDLCDTDKLNGLIFGESKEFIKIIEKTTRQAWFLKTPSDALRLIGSNASNVTNKKGQFAQQLLECDIFPHLGPSASSEETKWFLGRMVKLLVWTMHGKRAIDDRDNLANRRVETAGVLVGELFRTLWKRFTQTLKLTLMKKKQSCVDILPILAKMKCITYGVRNCMSTGNWGVQKSAYTRAGVAQVLNRVTYCATISHLRRIVIPIGREAKNYAIRQIHGSQFGFIDPAETPEGQQIGIVLNMSNVSTISGGIPTVVVRDTLQKHLTDVLFVEDHPIHPATPIFINGTILGWTEEPTTTRRHIVTLRGKRIVDPTVTVYHDDVDDHIYIWTDCGRMLRPLFDVANGGETASSQSWNAAERAGAIRWLSPGEIEHSKIAMWPTVPDIHNWDYCEIHPSMMLGAMTSLIPFVNHTQAPRICYQASMGKQALGQYALSHKLRTDTIAHTLEYGQRPLVSTEYSELLGVDNMPSGINAVVAILTYTGFNQEDSIIMNKSSIDRGLFTSTYYRTITICEKKKSSNVDDVIKIPDEAVGRKYRNYSLLDATGVVKKGVNVNTGDVIVGKITKTYSKDGNFKIADCSVVAKSSETGIVDRIVDNVSPQGYRIVKIVLRQTRIPEPGDKFASVNAQKGVVGMVYNECDMPFNREGITPDLIINPHCLTGDAMIDLGRHGWMPISKMRLHDGQVVTYDPERPHDNKHIHTHFYNYFSKMPGDNIVEITLNNGAIIRATKEHKLLLADGWVEAKDIRIRQSLPVVGHPEQFFEEPCDQRLKVMARIVGKLHAQCSERCKLLVVDCEQDLFDVLADLATLGEKAPFDPMNLQDGVWRYSIHFSKKLSRQLRILLSSYHLWIHTNRHYCREFLAARGWGTVHVDTPLIIDKSVDADISPIFKILGVKIKNRCIHPSRENILRCVEMVNWRYNHLEKTKMLPLVEMLKQNSSIPTDHAIVANVKLIPPQKVYDFTTIADTHSFGANGIVSHNCIPSRMTANQLMQTVLGKACCEEGAFGDSTAFSGTDIEKDICQRLAKHGWNRCGWERMTCGITGEPIKAQVFMGPTYYQRLKHMVQDKIHSRASGDVNILFRQPNVGRSRKGGLRYGEMERDCGVVHGTSRFLKERLYDMSDPYAVWVCDDCGVMTASDAKCQACDSFYVSKCVMPYATKLLLSELNSMSMKVKLNT